LRTGIAFLLVAGFVSGITAPARAQLAIGIDPPGFVPGGGPGFGWLGFGYGINGPRGAGYLTPLPDLGYYNAGGGPSPYYSPVFNAMPAAPADRQTTYRSSRYVPPGGVARPGPAPAAARPRRGFLGRLFGPR
jgi:hypothetical protein